MSSKSPTKLSELPDGHRVAFDTETSALFEDWSHGGTKPGARISAVSWAYRDPEDDRIVTFAMPFDQGFELIEYGDKVKGKRELPILGVDSGHLPLGPKNLPRSHRARVDKWVKEHGPQIGLAPNQPPEKFVAFAKELSRHRLIAHSAKFDLLKFQRGLRGMEHRTGIDLSTATVADTQVTQYITEPRFSSALKPTGVRLGLGAELGLEPGTEADEQEALRPWKGPVNDPRFDLIPWRVLKPYAALDAGLTLMLDEYQQAWFADGDPVASGFLPHVRREFELMRVLFAMEVRGIGFDKQTSQQQADEIARRLEKLRERLPFKPTGPGARKYYFGLPEEGGLGRIPYSDKMTEGGQASIDDEVVRRLAKDGAPHAEVFAEHEKTKNAASKWYQSWANYCGEDGRIRTSHRQTKVVSGRLSVEGVQLHAIPQPYQTVEGLVPVIDLFRPAPGKELWSIDVSQAEIRIATAMAACQEMLDQYLAGRDSHDAATMLMFGDEFGTEVLERAKDYPKWHEYRQVAKRCNLGILYGAGVNTVRSEIAEYTGIVYPQHRVRGWIEDWKAAFPPMVQFYNASERAATTRGWAKLINGRIRYFSDHEPTRKAANQIIQGSQAEALKECLITIEHAHPDVLLHDVHDAVWVETDASPEGRAVVADCKRIIIEVFERTFERRWRRGGPVVRVPFEVDVKPVGTGK